MFIRFIVLQFYDKLPINFAKFSTTLLIIAITLYDPSRLQKNI